MQGQLKAQRHEEACALAELIQAGGHLADVLVLLVDSKFVPLDLVKLMRREVRRYQTAIDRYAKASRERTIAAARSSEAGFKRRPTAAAAAACSPGPPPRSAASRA